MFATRTLAPMLLIASAIACGGGKSAAEAMKQKGASEAKAKGEADAKRAEALAKRKAEREAKEKAEEEATAKRKAELAKLVIVPDKLAKDYVKACEAASKAHNELMTKHLTGPDLDNWNGNKDGKLSMTVVQCTQSESTKVAACQKHALENAGPEFTDHVKELLQACTDKFGRGGGGTPSGAAVPSKPPGK